MIQTVWLQSLLDAALSWATCLWTAWQR